MYVCIIYFIYIYVGMRISRFIVRLCLSFSLCIDFGHDVRKQRANMLIDTFKCFLQFNSNYLSVCTLQIQSLYNVK